MDKKLRLKKNKNQRGISIYLAVLIMSVIMAVVLGLNTILIGQIKTIRRAGYSVTAYYAAETGMEAALNDPSCTSTCGVIIPFEGVLDLEGGGTASYSVQGEVPGLNCPGTEYCLKSVGTFQQTERAIQISK
jgi:hypothetical protein